MTAQPWRPLLEGAEADHALAAVQKIAAAIAPLMLAGDADADLAEGTAGGALLFAALERAGRHGAGLPTAALLLERAVQAMRRERLPPGLWDGTAGVAFAHVQLQGRLPSPELTRRLGEWVRGGAGGRYDLLQGAVGVGVLGLELAPDPRGAALLEAVLELLARTAEERDGGLTWATARPAGAALGPYDLGVAHGVPGVIGLLAGATASLPDASAARALLEGAVRWVLARRLTGADGCLPYAAGGSRDGERARLAWCYGDAGAAVTLLLAARALGDEEVERAARELAAGAAARRPGTAGVEDAGVCHGSAGLAQLFGRLWQLTGDDRCAAAGRDWLRRTLEWPRPHADPGILTGACGVALVLLAACGHDEPGWDRALLASRPIRASSV